MVRIDPSPVVNVLMKLGIFEPIERAGVRWTGYSLRAWGSTSREGLPYIPSLLLMTVGRRGGDLREHVLFTLRDGEDFIVVASKSGSPTHPDWFRNLEAHPQAWVTYQRRRVPIRAEVVDEADRARLWPRLVTMWPRYEDHQRRAAPRIVPVVRLRPGR